MEVTARYADDHRTFYNLFTSFNLYLDRHGVYHSEYGVFQREGISRGGGDAALKQLFCRRGGVSLPPDGGKGRV